MRTILIATDFSEASKSAIKAALPFLNEHSASKIILFHAWQKIDRHDAHEKAKNEQIEQKALQNLSALRAVLKENGISVEMLLVEGAAAHCILEQSTLQNADLIILGSSQENNVLKLIVGSTALHVLRNARVPALIFPPGIQSESHFKRITYATDYHDGDAQVIEQLLEIFAPFHPQINLLHISVEAISAEKELELMKSFQKQITEQITYNNFSFQVMHGESLNDQLRSYIASEPADLLVLSTHSRKLFEIFDQESAGKLVLEDASVPLLAFHYRQDFSPKIF